MPGPGAPRSGLGAQRESKGEEIGTATSIKGNAQHTPEANQVLVLLGQLPPSGPGRGRCTPMGVLQGAPWVWMCPDGHQRMTQPWPTAPQGSVDNLSFPLALHMAQSSQLGPP